MYFNVFGIFITALLNYGLSMTIRHIGILSPGDMGQAVAQTLIMQGRKVYCALDGRSSRTKSLAASAGLEDCGDIGQLVNQCELIISIMNPGAALDNAIATVEAMHTKKKYPLYIDCNAIAPQTMQKIANLIHQAGGQCLDGGIIGPPPRGKASMRLYVSGPNADLINAFNCDAIKVRVISDNIGDASALKMCYASFTKGAMALGMEMLIAARKMGVDQALDQELKESAADNRQWILSRSVVMPPKAHRWVPEMQEIAKTFSDIGLTPKILLGASDMYEMIAATSLGLESPEDARNKARDGQTIVNQLADESSK